jgi:hypothetical protein
VTSGYVCERCGSRYGVLIKSAPAFEERRRALAICVTRECLPIREILNAHAIALRSGEITNAEEVIDAIEAAEKRWLEINRGWAQREAEVTLAEPRSAELMDPTAWPATNTAIKALCDTWIARWGAGSAPGDVIRNAALTLKKEGAPWDAVVRSFQRYVDIVENTFASPYAWRKKWRSYDPETPEHDHEGAAIADSMDRQVRQRSRAQRSQGGLQRLGETLKKLPEGR